MHITISSKGRYIIGAMLIAGVIGGGAAGARAQTTDERIRELQRQIAELQSELNALLAQQSGGEFLRDLRYGMENDADVRRLQTVLQQWGFYQGPVTGGFFEMTRSGVMRFQAAENIPATGYFGPRSRAAANRRIAAADQRPIIDGISGPSVTRTGEAVAWVVSARDPEGKALSYAVKWGDGTSDTPLGQSNSVSHTYQQSGTFRFEVTVRDEGGKTATSTKSVDVGASVALSVRTSATLSASVGKPFQAVFTVSGGTGPFVWGLEGAPGGMNLAASNTGANDEMLIGTPGSAGTFRMTITAQDRFGNRGSGSFTLTVLPVTAVAVLAPNGGEVWLRTSPQSFRWSMTPSGNADIYLRNADTNQSVLVAQRQGGASLTWTPAAVAAGRYRVRIYHSDAADEMDESDATFEITAATSTLAVSDINPRSGDQQTRITLTGERFADTNTIHFGSSTIVNVSRSGRTVSFVPPNAATNGPYAVTVQNAAGVSNAVTFQLTVKPPITVTRPDQSAVWSRGSTQTISWDAVGVTKFNVTLIGAGTLESYAIALGTQSKSLNWNVPNSMPPGIYTVRVANADRTNEYDDANTAIEIR